MLTKTMRDHRPSRLAAHTPASGERGQGLAEYTMLIGFITLVGIAAITAFGPKVASLIASAAGG
jgi:Flp pilus assembly pilin Flp